MENNDLLVKPLKLAGFSNYFCERSALMGFSDLVSILAVKPEELFKRKGFSHIWFGELTKFLIEKEMLYLLLPNPGKSRV